MTWLDNQIKNLEESTSQFASEINTIKKINPGCFNEFEEVTPLKLIFLHYSLSIYSSIIYKNVFEKKFFENMFYIDLFAGSGLNKLKTKKDILIGSPFIAVLNHKDKFTKFFFCENKPKFQNTLNLRLNSININNFQMYPNNCNQEIDSILNEINKATKPHSFFFIDPYSMEFEWDSMKKVLNSYSDILFTFMTQPIERARQAAFSLPTHKTKALDTFYGDKSWNDPSKSSVEIYKENIIKVRSNGLLESIRIGNYYDLIFITNKTRGQNKWMRGILKAKNEIESNSKKAVKIALDKLFRGQTDLLERKWN